MEENIPFICSINIVPRSRCLGIGIASRNASSFADLNEYILFLLESNKNNISYRTFCRLAFLLLQTRDSRLAAVKINDLLFAYYFVSHLRLDLTFHQKASSLPNLNISFIRNPDYRLVLVLDIVLAYLVCLVSMICTRSEKKIDCSTGLYLTIAYNLPQYFIPD